MPAPRSSNAKHERNLERNLELTAGTSQATEPGPVPRADVEEGAAAKLAREAARREAVRRVTGRQAEEGDGS